MTLTSQGAFATTALTPAGTYNVAVTATDTSTPSALSGVGNLPVIINLVVTNSTLSTTATHLVADILTTVTTTGNTGTVTYDLDANSKALGFAISNAAGHQGEISVVGVGGAISSPITITVTATDGTKASGSSAFATYNLAISGVTVL
jgi:hypothetical protein